MSTETSEDFEVDGSVSIPALHRDLARKYRNVGSKVEDIWRAFSPRQREEALRESTGDGEVLKHSRDPGLDGLRCLIPEYNLKDMTTTPEHFLEIFQYRSTAPLGKQFCVGVNDGPGDRETIENSIAAYDLRHPHHGFFGNQLTVFLEGDRYGQSCQLDNAAAAQQMMAVAPIFCVPRSKGELIITRQTYLLQFLNHLVEEILDLGSDSRTTQAHPKKESEAVTTAMSKLAVQPRTQKMSISDVISGHRDLEVYRSSPRYGRRIDRQGETSSDPSRADERLPHGVSSSTRHVLASKKFRRTPNPNDHTQWRITMKGRPENCTVTDPQLHYVLRLCHPDTSPAAAAQRVQKLDDHNVRHPQDGKRMHENQITAFGDLTIIVSFMHSMSTSIALTPISRKSGLLYVSRMTDLDTEIDHHKAQADFGDFLVPMGNLLEPDMSARALAALDDFIVDTTGARLGALYEDIIQDSLDDLESMYAKAKAKVEQADKKSTYVPLAANATLSPGDRVQRRREKEKTRPLGAIYDITAAPHPPEIILTEPAEQIKVKASTAAVFAILFSRREARGSVAWTDFEAALADLGFSVTPKGGSIYTFNPPESMNASPITLHRPHASEIEGYKLLIFARRLSRVYGWNAQTFEIA
ncbi:hypothetical protein LTR91_015474 [Friedmanniomyces endolithicus]|uniref:Uncharacterized protein n=1 Tax=Friedmanniomyces endolithicus TaxID=329885 RepID=A0AAN6QMZ2_9PEZI|nr:hypothetical protein LTR94_007705 [Friedmanniomyces endolithicus]KAK0800153.1 hypothetical protein LTR38_007295 [Friedmanniomyces endolithicus]KAK0810008.1 hypothetical protein LTR59_002410 [Friedmanniomyces endolithicus]KAK0863019.1 hypothetical protein LTS02_006825 [Friedmanniomyces endolithicus]KAK0881498.1 hypothetical protein LTR87_004639 [Friedmanniomyces endolithicus]